MIPKRNLRNAPEKGVCRWIIQRPTPFVASLLQVCTKFVPSSTGGIYVTILISAGAFIGNDNGEFTTDRNGQFTITGLTPGVTVTATQTATVSGYILDTSPQNILIKKGNAQSVTFYNAPNDEMR